MNSITVYVTSCACVKIDAVKAAYQIIYPNLLFNIIGIKSNSDVSEQPIGIQETEIGCKNRIDNCLSQIQFNLNDIIISIENGVFMDDKNITYDAPFICIYKNACKKMYYPIGHVIFPTKYYYQSKNTNKTLTVGSIIEKTLNLSKGNWHQHFDYFINNQNVGKKTRLEIIIEHLILYI